MLTFFKGEKNRIRLRVSSSVDIGGFSALVAACPNLKTVEDITVKDCYITFEESDFPYETRRPMQGTLIVLDANGDTVLRFLFCYEVVTPVERQSTKFEQVLYLTLVSTKGTTGGATPIGNYVTQGELRSAVEECEEYTDEQIADIGETIIEKQPIHIVDPQGQPVEVTVQQTAQYVSNMQADIEEGKATHTIASVKDEDHDGQPDGGILYLNPSNPH